MNLYAMCVCGMIESDCLRQQRREESRECCDDRVAELEAELPVCRHCGAVDAGSQADPDGRCVDCRVQFIYTDAPASYDYWYTTQMNECAGIDSRGKAWRCVRVVEDRVKAQSSRYQSGWHAAMPPRDWQRAVIAGIVTVPGGSS